MEENEKNSIISVIGEGKIKSKINMVKIEFELAKIEKTIREAQIKINKEFETIMNILKNNKIVDENISYSDFNFRPSFTFEDGKTTHNGEQSERQIICFIYDLNKNLDIAKNIMDEISEKTEYCRFYSYFTIDNYDELLIKARDLAMDNANEKAKYFANKANLKIIKAIKISEFEPFNYDSYSRLEYIKLPDSQNYLKMPLGNVEVNKKVFCDYIAK